MVDNEIENTPVEMETRDIVCGCQAVLGTLKFPVGTSEPKWAHALSAYMCNDCAAQLE